MPIEISDPSALPAHPLVSVYTLTYRHEAYIADAIEGVIAQQCDFSIELIIGEDCSPDRTRAIVLNYQKRYPHLIRMLTANRNIGTLANAERCRQAARGEFIAVCEGDDYWHHPRKLQMQVDAMRQDPTITLCHTDIDQQLGRIKLHSVNALRRVKHIAQGPDAYASLLLEWTPTTATTMYRKSVLKAFNDSRFNRSDWPFADYNKALFASVHGKIVYLPLSTATWRKVSGSATNSGHLARLRMGRALADCRECFMAAYPPPSDIVEQVRAGSHRRIMADAFVAHDEALYLSSWNWLVGHGFRSGRVAHWLRLAAFRLHVSSKLIMMGRKLWRLRRLRLILHVASQLFERGTRGTRAR